MALVMMKIHRCPGRLSLSLLVACVTSASCRGTCGLAQAPTVSSPVPAPDSVRHEEANVSVPVVQARWAPFSDAIAYATEHAEAVFEVARVKWRRGALGPSQFVDIILFRRSDETWHLYRATMVPGSQIVIPGSDRSLLNLSAKELSAVRVAIGPHGGLSVIVPGRAGSEGTGHGDSMSEGAPVACILSVTTGSEAAVDGGGVSGAVPIRIVMSDPLRYTSAGPVRAQSSLPVYVRGFRACPGPVNQGATHDTGAEWADDD